jgi:Zinc dependent phospholipase C
MFRRIKSRSHRFARGFRLAFLLACLLLGVTRSCCAYSLLTHEEIVDIFWKDQIQPLLLKRFPGSTPEQLRQAHAYAYGGSLMQDIGYYPFGNAFLSDLTHCVRTGDFVTNLIQGSQDLDQYAFALGALSHYCSDTTGHPFINHAVALCFPKLRAKYGDSVTYEDCPKAHIQTEFGFDITQVAKQRYTSDRYHDFIGFEVSKPLLERAFFKTYGLELGEVLTHVDLAIGTFRRAASQIIPEMTRAAVTAYHPETVKDNRDASERLFLYHLSRAQYEKQWGKDYRKPGLIARVLGLIIRIIPKVGILDALAFKLPTPQTEDLYIQSVNRTVTHYRWLLRQVANDNLHFANADCDTGRPTAPGEYPLADETYAQLLEALLKRGLEDVPPDLRSNILAFYASGELPTRTRKERRLWRRTAMDLAAFKAGPGSALAAEVRARLLAPPPKLQSPKAADTQP